MTLDVLRLALALRPRFGLSYWDSAILAAARLTGCDLVYSEDFSHEQDYDGLACEQPLCRRSARSVMAFVPGRRGSRIPSTP